MRLKDLVHRSALRRGAGETEIAAPPQVFEVTDLYVPAGTDWSVNGYVLGQPFEVEFGRTVVANLMLRVIAPLNADDLLRIAALEGEEGADSTFLSGSGGNPNAIWTWERTAFGAGSPTFGWNAVEAESLMYGAALLTDFGPTHADIHIVRARAAFQVI